MRILCLYYEKATSKEKLEEWVNLGGLLAGVYYFMRIEYGVDQSEDVEK